MSDDWLTNRIRQEIDRYLRPYAQPRNGIVTAYDPNTYSVKVNVYPEAADQTQGETVQSNWIKLHTQWVGNGWGLMVGPIIGAQVAMRFQEGDYGSPSVEGHFFDQTNKLPQNGGPPSGEFWLVDGKGQYIKLLSNSSVKVQINSGQEIDIGNLQNSLQTICLKAFHDWVENHTHTGVQSGSSDTGPPSSSPPSNSLTTITQAN